MCASPVQFRASIDRGESSKTPTSGSRRAWIGPKDPLEASNRRISIIVEYVSRENAEDANEAGEGGGESKGAAKKKEEGAAQEGAEYATPKSE